MPPLAISAAHARRFLVSRHLLAPPRSLPPTPASVLAVVERLGSLQFDPLEVPGARSHESRPPRAHPPLPARVLRRAALRRARERRLFEAYNKSLNILPLRELPFYRAAWDRATARYDDRILRAHAADVDRILAAIRAEGPLGAARFKGDLEGQIPLHWAPTSKARAILEALFEMGRVGIARREGNRRSFDLVERLFPPPLLDQRVTHEAALRHRVLSRHRGVGLMGAGGASELVVFTGTAAERARVVAALVEEGALIEVEVEGVRGVRHVLAGERAILAETERARSRRARDEVTFLAPLDPLMWDRRLLRELFAFDYRWEVYIPAHEREHGYYMLPILFGDRFVGRVEPRFERATSSLAIRSVHFEDGFEAAESPQFLDAFARALADYRTFVGATRVTFGRARPVRALAAALAKRGEHAAV